jgi:DNA-binding CsgD family transcriptional regulator
VDVEREWLDLVATILATPITVLPEERIAVALTETFDAPGCAFHSRPAAAGVIQRIYPRGFLSEVEQAELIQLAVEAPTFHPLLHYYLATGDSAPQQVADVPAVFGGQRVRARWAELSRAYAIEHQLAIPLPLGPAGPRWFVVGRDTAFPAARMLVARRVQRLIVGLDRQAAALTRWQARAPLPESRAVAADVRLTPRELAVLGLVADGLTAAAAARRLLVAERTVHKHLERVYAKLGVSDRVSAVLRGQRLGILPESALSALG